MKKFLVKNVFAKDSGYEVIEVADDAKEIYLGEEVIVVDGIDRELEPIVVTHQCKFEIGETREEAQETGMFIEFPAVRVILELLPKDFNGIDEKEFINQQIDVLNDEIITSQTAMRSITESALDGVFGAKGMTLN